MADNNIHIAQSFADDTFAADQPIMAGDTPPLSTKDVLIVTALGAIPQYTPLSFAAGAYKLWAVGEEVAAVTMYAIPDQAVDQRAAVAVQGMFNIDKIKWPATTTEDQVAAATINTGCQFRKLLYSDKRVTKSGVLVGDAFHAPTTG